MIFGSGIINFFPPQAAVNTTRIDKIVISAITFFILSSSFDIITVILDILILKSCIINGFEEFGCENGEVSDTGFSKFFRSYTHLLLEFLSELMHIT